MDELYKQALKPYNKTCLSESRNISWGEVKGLEKMDSPVSPPSAETP